MNFRALPTTLATRTPVTIARADLDQMLRFARAVIALKENRAYLDALETQLPAMAKRETGWPSMLMGFDFHLTSEGPKLIEINNNAGGLYVGEGAWLPQPALDQGEDLLPEWLLAMFHPDWSVIAIMDEDVVNQYMYPEMQAYAALLEAAGRRVFLVSPEDFQCGDDGLYVAGVRIDAIYNRHTDFYLESAALQHVRAAYAAGQVALNPHPRSYALIGDKSRMVDWWRTGFLEGCVDGETVELIRAITPQTLRFSEVDAAWAWDERKQWVFKPAARHGGKGVILGKGMSRKRFATLDAETIMQRLVVPSAVETAAGSMKFDLRLYLHGTQLIALAGRLWRGQVTNFREPGSGWVAIDVA